MTKKNTTSTPQDDYYETHPSPAPQVSESVDKKPKVLKIKAKKPEDQVSAPAVSTAAPHTTPRTTSPSPQLSANTERRTLDQILSEKNKIKTVSRPSQNLVSFEAAAVVPPRQNAPVAGSLPRDTSRFVASARRKPGSST